MTSNLYAISPLTTEDIHELLSWQYPAPYDLYNGISEDIEREIAYFLNPANRCYALRTANSAFVGFCSFGEDGQVPGGNYDRPALDIGIGIKPTLTGQGNGNAYMRAIETYAVQQAPPPERLRVTIAAFNERAQRVARNAGYQEVQRFVRAHDGQEFVVLEKELASSP